LITFTVGSTLCGFAGSTETMIAARVLQGIGGGMIMPVGMAMIYMIVPLEKRGVALGVMGCCSYGRSSNWTTLKWLYSSKLGLEINI